MLLAYLDEFGHIGPFISKDHNKFKDHPVFGYAGFVIPAHNVRYLGGLFEFLKKSLLEWEISQSGKHPARWEKKGASLLTTKNIENHGSKIKPVLKRLFRKLDKLDGRLVFVGQLKPVGSPAETGESTSDRSAHVLRQVIKELADYADSLDEDILIFLDAVDSKARLEALSVSASFIYASSSANSVKRVLEAPMQLESHLYGTTQFADWICALISRASHYHLTNTDEFLWAPGLLREVTKTVSATPGSRIQKHHSGQQKNNKIKINSLKHPKKYLDSLPSSKNKKSAPQKHLTHKIGASSPDLQKFYSTLKSDQ